MDQNVSIKFFSANLAICFFILCFLSWSNFVSFLIGQFCYTVGLLFCNLNFVMLQQIGLSGPVFLALLLIANFIKVTLIFSLAFLASGIYADMDWLFFIIGLITALKTIFFMLLPKS